MLFSAISPQLQRQTLISTKTPLLQVYRGLLGSRFSFPPTKWWFKPTYTVLTQPGAVSPARSVPRHILRPEYAESSVPTDTGSVVVVNDCKAVDKIKASCRLARETMDYLAGHVKAGVTTDTLDSLAHDYIVKHNAYPSPLNYCSFPKSLCTSVNNVLAHGIPNRSVVLAEGDIVSVDVTVYLDGYHGDLCETFAVGQVDADAQHLIDVAKQSISEALSHCRPGQPIAVLGNVVESYVKANGLSVCRTFLGHGVGTHFHMAPDVLPFANQEPGPTMQPGMVFTIEPVVCEGNGDCELWEDGWTAASLDGSRGAQFEHTVLITETGAIALTATAKEG